MVGTVNNFDIYIYFYNESKTLITVEKYRYIMVYMQTKLLRRAGTYYFKF